MMLLVDIGNTRAKWRSIREGCSCDEGVLNNNELSRAAIEMLVLRQGIKLMVVSSVGRADIVSLFSNLAKEADLEYIQLHSAEQMGGLLFRYEDIGSMGVDRCLAMLGAWRQKGVLVIDAGSAITADYLNNKGEHCGGYILPGCRMLMLSLKQGTSQVAVTAELGNSEPGLSTQACVSNGLTLLLKSLISAVVNRAGGYGIRSVVLTGGDADLIFRACPDISFELKKNLVLDGMQKIIEA